MTQVRPDLQPIFDELRPLFAEFGALSEGGTTQVEHDGKL